MGSQDLRSLLQTSTELLSGVRLRTAHAPKRLQGAAQAQGEPPVCPDVSAGVVPGTRSAAAARL